MKVKLIATPVLATGCMLLCGAAWGTDGPEVIRRLQERFADLSTLSARFDRSHYLKLWDEKHKIKGQLFVQRPSRFRFETRVQTVVTDGEHSHAVTVDGGGTHFYEMQVQYSTRHKYWLRLLKVDPDYARQRLEHMQYRPITEDD